MDMAYVRGRGTVWIRLMLGGGYSVDKAYVRGRSRVGLSPSATYPLQSSLHTL